MTDDEAKALGLRAVACPGWRWVRGMVDTRGVLVMGVGEHTADVFDPRINGGAGRQVVLSNRILSPPAGYLSPPDFRDPATLGCLLALVREVCESAGCDVEIDAGTRASMVVIWKDHDAGTDTRSDGHLAELLVWALETITREATA